MDILYYYTALRHVGTSGKNKLSHNVTDDETDLMDLIKKQIAPLKHFSHPPICVTSLMNVP